MAVALIRGRVLDDKRRPLVGARIFVVSAPVSMPDIAQVTDKDGGFTVSAPVRGMYRIGVMAEKFAREEREMKVGDDAGGELVIQMRAEISP